MGGLLELSFLSSTRSITTTVSEYCYGWPPERYLPSFCGSNLEKAEDTVKVRSKWRPTAIIYLTTRAVIDEQRARKTCFHLYLYSYTEQINPVGWPTFNIIAVRMVGATKVVCQQFRFQAQSGPPGMGQGLDPP
eukprot:Em0023g699a